MCVCLLSCLSFFFSSFFRSIFLEHEIHSQSDSGFFVDPCGPHAHLRGSWGERSCRTLPSPTAPFTCASFAFWGIFFGYMVQRCLTHVFPSCVPSCLQLSVRHSRGRASTLVWRPPQNTSHFHASANPSPEHSSSTHTFSPSFPPLLPSCFVRSKGGGGREVAEEEGETGAAAAGGGGGDREDAKVVRCAFGGGACGRLVRSLAGGRRLCIKRARQGMNRSGGAPGGGWQYA